MNKDEKDRLTHCILYCRKHLTFIEFSRIVWWSLFNVKKIKLLHKYLMEGRTVSTSYIKAKG